MDKASGKLNKLWLYWGLQQAIRRCSITPKPNLRPGLQSTLVVGSWFQGLGLLSCYCILLSRCLNGLQSISYFVDGHGFLIRKYHRDSTTLPMGFLCLLPDKSDGLHS